MALNLQKYIGQMTTQLQPVLDAFLKQLGIKTGREEARTIQKAQAMGRVTTGFLPEMKREVREEAGMQEAGFRGTHASNIMNLAMQLFGVESEWERFRQELEWKKRESALDRALERELAKMRGKGVGGEGISFAGLGGLGKGGVSGRFRDPTLLETYTAKGQAMRTDIPRRTDIQGRMGFGGTTYKKKAYQPTQKATYYRGRRLGRI